VEKISDFLVATVVLPLDESSDDTTSGFDTKRERSNIEQEILRFLGGVTGENSSLNGCTINDGLIRVDALIGSLPLKKSDKSFTIRGIQVEPRFHGHWPC